MEAAIDFSIWALFSRATLPVQAVIVLLIGLSIWSWTIAINKRIALNLARRRSAKFDKAFWSGEPLDGLFDKIGAAPKGGSELIFTAGMTEWRRSHRSDGVLIAGAQSRIERSMDVALAKQSNDLQSGLAILASIGSVAPFIGLFGTVWGIMNAFIEIAAQQNTNLAVVAPGIAEALLATGLGLLAAIPAVVFYNHLSVGCDRVIAGYEAFADEFSTILSRQLGGWGLAMKLDMAEERSGGRRRRRRSRPVAEINVTPFVDVMLVLLIVFMVAAPLLTVGVDVDLPKTAAGALPSETEEPLTVTLTAEGAIVIQTTETPETEFLTRLRGIAQERADDKVFLRADGAIPYARVMQVMGAMNAAGFGNIGLVTDLGGPTFDGSGG